MKSNRYIIAFAGVILHLMLGSTYAWSVYRNPIIEKNGMGSGFCCLRL
ncbi:formate antiporter domain protein [Streptococcus pneumoniae 2070768]|nr:formate antiporter domain protein [Streptococcus pneumoniae 2070768]